MLATLGRLPFSRGGSRGFRRMIVALGVLVALATVVASAGAKTSAAPPVRTVNFGAGSIKVGGAPLKIAFLDICAACNAWSVSNTQATLAEAKKDGVKVSVFDSNFDALKQVSQFRTALSQGYNGMIIIALSPEMCTLTKQAIKKGVLISIVNQHVCSSVYATGNAIWLPGTVNFIGGDQTQDMFTRFLTTVAAANPGPQQVALLEGTPGLTQTLLVERSKALIEKKYPNFKVTSIQVPTYDITGAYNKLQAFLPANSGLTILAGIYSDMTQGAVKALQQAGRTNVKVYDMGGSKWAFGAVKSGAVQMTSVFLPATEGTLAVSSLYKAWTTGNPGPHYVDIIKTVTTPFITKANISGRQAQY